ncbi:MAG: hypothetical protein ACK5OA_02135 [Acidovorax sp.]|jgi:hypothetical protein
MRIPRFLTPFPSLSMLAGLVLLSPAALQAQGNPPAADASLPHAPTAPLVHLGMVPQTPLADAAPSATSWRESHHAVASFPRGHADIVAWEARNTAQPGPAAAHPTEIPAASREGHGPQSLDKQPAAHMKHHGHADHHTPGSKP